MLARSSRLSVSAGRLFARTSMFRPSDLSRFCAVVMTLLAGLVLAACSIGGGGGGLSQGLSGGEPQAGTQAAQSPQSQRLSAKVALLLPLGGTPQAAAIAKGMKQAAELALFDLNDPGFQLVVKDTKGTPEGAAAAATTAAAEGVELIVGPVFSKSVRAVSMVAQQAGLPVVAFSTDRSVAGNGVFLLSFSSDEEVRRIVSYAAAQGKRRYAALLPDSTYGTLIEQSFREAVSAHGGVVVALEKYPPNSNGMLEPSKRLFEGVKTSAESGAPVDAIFMPGGPETLPNLGPLVNYASLGVAQVRFLGSGGWDFPNLGRNNNFLGGWYPAPDPRGWQAFSEKFARTFGAAPPRIATLAHDAVTTAIQLAKAYPRGQRYTAANLTRQNGFAGIDGPFRFAPDGTARHSLAILEVQRYGASVIDPAPAVPPSSATLSAAPPPGPPPSGLSTGALPQFQ